MSLKLSVIKAAGVSMTEINRMDVFDFFVLLNDIDQKAEEQKVKNGGRG